ncbi:MAG: TraR/DksA C4-type zinc finger protein [Acidimicrobiales bacterium]|nr:TraR/DksA C4-type zinc finger protein [Acidimicrobiales bacterium]
MVTESVLQALRATLEDERAALARQLDALGEPGATHDLDPNFADSGQVAAEQGEARMLAGSLREQLGDVERALQAMADGAYGRCEQCGRDIGEARLEAVPTARRCIECAGRR